MTYHIAVGLPASGKTTEFKKLAEDSSSIYVDGDSFSSLDKLIYHVTHIKHPIISIYIDGLFITQESQDRLIASLGSHYTYFHYWKPNRPACLNNDKLRDRELSSTVTINNAIVHKPESIYDTYHTSAYTRLDSLLLDIPLDLPTNIYTESWSDGGDWRDCWDNGGDIEPEDPPIISELTIDNFDYCIQDYLNFLGYTIEELTKHESIFVMEDCGEGDYYGGYEHRSQYAIPTVSILEVFLKDRYDMEPSDLYSIKEQLPELFI